MENIKKVYKNYKFKISAPTWNDTFEPPDRIMYQMLKIIFENMLKKHREKTDNPSLRIYVNKIKAGYCFKLLTSETMKLDK